MVYLTGAGCGNKELITLKAIKALKKADVVIYDALVDPQLLEYAQKAELIYVGKRSKNHTLTQDEINKLLVKKAKTGKTVVRLKGGDPYVFGRGGEEGEYLRENGIDFEVIPGIASAIAGPAYAGIPVTHRDLASGFAVITGHRKAEADEYDYKVLAGFVKSCGSLIILMGMSRIGEIMEKLIKGGLNPDVPAAVIHMASTPKQKTVVGSVGTIAQKCTLGAPAVIVVGPVVALRESLNFYENKSPLYSKRILLTRSRAQISELKEKLADRLAIPIEFPTIKIKKNLEELERLRKTLKTLKDYKHLIFTSANGVDIFFELLKETGLDSRALSGLNIAAIGSGTVRDLKKYGITADLMPSSYIAESLVEEIMPKIKPGERILLPRSGEARPFLAEALSKKAEVNEINIYSTERDLENAKEIKRKLREGEIDALTFTSSSTVRHFSEAVSPEEVKDIQIFSIGPQTSKTLKDLGFKVTAQASEYSLDGLVEAMENYYRG